MSVSLHRVLVLVLVLVLALALVASAAAAQEPSSGPTGSQARAAWQRGLARYAAHEFDEAARDLEAAFAAEPRRDVLFAWAQALRLSGHCARAVELYRSYLGMAPSESSRRVAEGHIASCERAEPAAPSATPSREHGPAPARPPAQPPRAHEREREGPDVAPPRDDSPWYADGWGAVLTGASVATLAVGAGLYVVAGDTIDASAPSYDEHHSGFDRANTELAIGLTALGVGVVLLAAAIVRYATAD